MAAPADYLDIVDLKALVAGGLVNEDVGQKIWQLSYEDTPVLDRIGRDSAENSYTEWVNDDLGSASDTKIISGSDLSSYESATGSRAGNHTQINRRGVAITGRTRSTSNIGRSDEMTYQSMLASQRLKQDVERQILGAQASVADNNDDTAGVSAGLSAWIITNDDVSSGGSASGFNTSTKVVAARTRGVGQALSMADIRTQVKNAYDNYSDVSLLVTTPTIVQRINVGLLDATVGAAMRTTVQANVPGTTPAKMVAQGFFQQIVTDFGTVLDIVPDRHQPTGTTASGGSDHALTLADVFLINPEYLALGVLRGFRVEPVAKLGDADRAQALVDWTLMVYNEKAHAVIADVNGATAATA